MPELDEDHPVYSIEQQRRYYEQKGIVFLDDEWGAWHIRVWSHAREAHGFGVGINAEVVFRYADRFGMDDIETLERIKAIEQGANRDE